MKKNIRSLLCLALVLAMAMGLTACGGKSDSPADTGKDSEATGTHSIAIGFGIYFLIVRPFLMKDGAYLNRWPKWLDLEEMLYRPLLLKWLPGLFGAISAVFAENRVSAPLAKGIYRVVLTVTHALSDLVDALVLLIRRTLLRSRLPEHPNAAAENTLNIRYVCIVLSAVPIFVITPFVQKYLVSGTMLGAVKG